MQDEHEQDEWGEMRGRACYPLDSTHGEPHVSGRAWPDTVNVPWNASRGKAYTRAARWISSERSIKGRSWSEVGRRCRSLDCPAWNSHVDEQLEYRL